MINRLWIFALFALLLAGCATPQSTALFSPLSGVAAPREGHAKHEGSWDRSGKNDDWRAVEPGETITLFEHAGPAVVHRFWMTYAPRSEPRIARQAILRMYWDGQTTPAVEVPLGDFFGVGFGEQRDFISLPLSETSGGYNCYWPMPFHKSAKWTLENRSNRRIDNFYYNIDYTALDHPLDPALRHFAAQHRRENPTTPNQNYTILSTRGGGQFVGAMLAMQTLENKGLWFLEGDERITIDGAASPQIIGTGSEDYFSSGWYFDHGTYSAPYHGVTIRDEQTGRICAYRWHVEDAMPFDKSIDVSIEHGTNNDSRCDYSSVAYYYLDRNVLPINPPLPSGAANELPKRTTTAKHFPNVIEAEDLLADARATSGGVDAQDITSFGDGFSGGAQLWWQIDKPNETLSIDLPITEAGEYEVACYFTHAPDYAKVAVGISGVQSPATFDLYEGHVVPGGRTVVGRAHLDPTHRTMTIKNIGHNDKSSGFAAGIDAIEIRKLP